MNTPRQAEPEVKCSRAGCKRKTTTPKTSEWAYMDQAPTDMPHWVGWWCPACSDSLLRLFNAHGVPVTSERVQ
jgi:hypothetical protein